MRFETVPAGEVEGAILVHSLRAGARLLKKGRILTAEDAAELGRAGVARVTVARLEPGDVAEDAAAARIATALAGPGTRAGAAFTGRSNIYAQTAGLALIDPTSVEAANLVDDALTVATLPPLAMVAPGDMVATVKVIPYAAPEPAVAKVAAAAGKASISVAAFRPRRVALITTALAGKKPLHDKTRAATAARLAPLGGTLMYEKTCAHETSAVSAALTEAEKAGAELLLVSGASAISDKRDVVPSGIVAAGGGIVHFGMPVDPGNLLLLAELRNKPVIGLPGCARSPKLNGLDFVLRRIFAGLAVTKEDIMRMGVGGLLTEIPERPQPRRMPAQESVAPRAPRIAGLVLAAGLSSRMGSNKLLAEFGGAPLIRRTVENALASEARPIVVVTGHEADAVEGALAGLGVTFVRNPDYAAGLSASLRAGLAALPDGCDGVLVMLGDMPEVSAALIDRMIAAFSPADGRAICVATAGAKRGNPVLWARRFFPEIAAVAGDAGAKHLIGEHEDAVCEVEAGEAAFSDVDTPEELATLRKHAPAGAAT